MSVVPASSIETRPPSPRVRLLGAAAVIGFAAATGGCSTLVAVASHPAVTGAGVVAMLTTGKGLADHALDMVTERDCRLVDGLVRADRRLCERPGSPATLRDFRGLALFRGLMPDDPPPGLTLSLDEPPTAPPVREASPAFSAAGRAPLRLALSIEPHSPLSGRAGTGLP